MRLCLSVLGAAVAAWGQAAPDVGRAARKEAPLVNPRRDQRTPAPAILTEPVPALVNPPGGLASTTPIGNQEPPPFTNYRLGSEDLISVLVLDAPEFSRQVRVNTEGVIRLPLVRQPIPASGKTVQELEETVARVLVEEGLLREPTVTVTVREFQSKPLTLTGAVRMPMVMQVVRPMTLSEALARAGGISDTAGPEILVTFPAAGDRPRREIRVSAHGLYTGTDPSANLMLYGGEEVRALPAGRVYIIGGVARPGPVLLSDDRPLTLLQAVSLVGGPLPSAAKKAFLLRRAGGEESAPKEIAFDLKKLMGQQERNMILQPNDVIFVPDSQLKRLTQGGVASAVTSLAYTAIGAILWR